MNSVEFYLDRVWPHDAHISTALLTCSLFIADVLFHLVTGTPLLVGWEDLFLYSLRVVLLAAGLLGLRYVWLNLRGLSDRYLRDGWLRDRLMPRLIHLGNDPLRHAIAGAFLVVLYYSIVYAYFIPLGRHLAHIFVNTARIFVLGAGAHVAIGGIGFLHTLQPKERAALSKLLDPYHPDGMGGMGDVSAFVVRIFLVGSIYMTLCGIAFI